MYKNKFIATIIDKSPAITNHLFLAGVSNENSGQ